MIHLEPVAAAALEAFAPVLSQLHGICFPDDPWPPQTFAELAAMPGCFGRIASERAGLAGLALAQAVGEDCEILTLGVSPARRRTGIGSALLAEIAAEAGHLGARTLFLEVAEDNIAARALYAACGFVQIGRRANYYRRRSGLAAALVMRLLLAT